MSRTLHLICNAHLDPAWLWEWQEGAAAAISTFRVAAELCERHRRFVFCHNEAVLYRWVEEYEPALFRRIQRLVAKGRWRIMGGWWLQPDCNMPSGESLVRQILLGRRYFAEKFGVAPTTALNFDSFGHNRGLPQILAKAGFDSYLICRPANHECPLPANDFTWVGVDGTRIAVSRSGGYNTPLGRAHEKVEGQLKDRADEQVGYVLWGVGNHGGGPSDQDVRTLDALIDRTKAADGTRIMHSWPERFFADLSADLAASGRELPLVEHALNPFAVGCYTSQVRIKQRHRRLEGELFTTEAMAAVASAQKLMAYPAEELAEAARDLSFAQFHDILPGSSIQAVEEASLFGMDHGLELLARAKARAFFALAQGQPAARAGEIPVLVHNPHPWPVEAEIECEFQLADQNWKKEFTNPIAYRDGERLPSQCEQEASNLPLDWRKRIVFRARLEPGAMNRFDCRLEVLPERPVARVAPEDGCLVVRNADGLEVAISLASGLVERWRVGGVDVARAGALAALVMRDNEDPWGMTVRSFRDHEASFALMTPDEGARFAGLPGALPSVRVIEDGPVRTVIETLFAHGRSAICQRYLVPKSGTELGLEVRVQWAEKSRMLKLALPLVAAEAGWQYHGQVAYGRDRLPENGDEAVAQQWVAAVSPALAVTCIGDGGYGSDFTPVDGIRLSLMRSPAYSGHPLGPDRPVLRTDRFTPRQDQGERLFRFWFNAGAPAERLARIDAEAAARLRPPMALSFFPHGGGRRPRPGPSVSDPAIQLGCCKRADSGKAVVLRLFNAAAEPRAATVTLPAIGLRQRLRFAPFEIKTLLVRSGKAVEADLLERPLAQPKRRAAKRRITETRRA